MFTIPKFSNKAFLRNVDDLYGNLRIIIKTERLVTNLISDINKDIISLVKRFYNSDAVEDIILLEQDQVTVNTWDEELKKIESRMNTKFGGFMRSSVYKSYNAGRRTAQNQLVRIKSNLNFPPLSITDKNIIQFINDTDFSLIKTLNKTHINKAREIFAYGIRDGLNRRKIISQIQSYVGNTNYQARRIVRTEITRSAATGSRRRFLDSGLTFWQWNTALDERVCEVCAPLHGKVVKIGENFIDSFGKVNNITQPPAHPFCRCGISPAFRIEKPAEIKPEEPEEPELNLKGFSDKEEKEIKKYVDVIPIEVKNRVKALNGVKPIIKTEGDITEDEEVRSVISPAVLNKYHDATGFYVGGTYNRIFISNKSGIDDTLHEIGHAIYNDYINLRKNIVSKWNSIHEQHKNNGDFLLPRCSVNEREHFADSFRYYLLYPETLKLRFPEIYDYIEKNIFIGV